MTVFNFTNNLCAALVPAYSKSAKKTNSLIVFFVLLGSVCARAAHKMMVKLTLVAPTFYEKLLRQYSFAKMSQSQTIIRENLHKAFLYEKGAHKTLMKLTPIVNFTNILSAAFAQICGTICMLLG